MKKLYRFLALALTFTFLFVTSAYSAPTYNLQQSIFTPNKTTDFKDNLSYEPDQVIIKFKDNSPASQKAVVMKKLSLKKLEKLGNTNAEVVETPKGKMKNVIGKLKSSKDVEYAVPNYRFQPAGISSDTLFPRQWGLENTGQQIVDNFTGSFVSGTDNIDINAPSAWESLSSPRETLVGVLDTGIDISHPDLQDKIWVNPGEIPGDGIDNDNNGYVDDIYGWNFAADNNEVFDYSNPFADGHGTTVAGVIAANTDNNFGIAGVAPNARIVCLKFIGADGEGSLSDAIRALDYARQQGIKVINASWGSYFPERSSDPEYYAAELKPLAKAILDSKALFIAAAGNEGENLDTLPEVGYQYFPAAFKCPNLISVAAVDNCGYLCNYENIWASNFGEKTVDLAAPGHNVLSTVTVGDYFGAAVEGIRGSSRTACWGFGLQDIAGSGNRTDLVKRELQFLCPRWNAETGKKAPRILLVDDDNSEASYPECSSYWKEALDELDMNYHEYLVPSNTGNTSDGPTAKEMKKYDLVIWQTGRNYEPSPQLTINNVQNLTTYIEKRGSILLSGENAISGNEVWAAEMLQAQLITEGLPCYDLTGLSGTTYEGFHCIMDGSDLGAPPIFHDLYCPTNPGTAMSGLTYKFAYISGTSIAAPHVAGTAALLFGQEPNLSLASARNIILKSARPLPDLAGKVTTGCIIDAHAALTSF